MIEQLIEPGYRCDTEDRRPVEEFFDVPQIAAARASVLALESALTHGTDMPCGAVAVRGDRIVGRGFAGDKRLGFDPYHAELAALGDAEMGRITSHAPPPDTLVVTFEPCGPCQSIIPHACPEITKVYYAVGREDLEERGLLKIRPKIDEGGVDGYYEKLPEGPATWMNRVLLDHVQRDLETGEVTIDTEGLTANIDGTNFTALDLMKDAISPTSPHVNRSYLGLMATVGHRLHRLVS